MSNYSILRNGVTLAKSMNETAYIVDEKEQFFLTGYKILKSQEMDFFIKCEKLLYNGKTKLVYFSSVYKSFSSQFETLKQEEVLAVLAKLIKAVVVIQNNAFLDCRNIDLSMERIFLDRETGELRLIYLPLKTSSHTMDEDFETEFRGLICEYLFKEEKFLSEQGEPLETVLKDETLTLDDISKKLFDESKRLEEEKRQEAIVLGFKNAKKHKLILSLEDRPDIVTLSIGEEDYLIGKNAAVVDGVLAFNPAISRRHCKVSFYNGNFYVTDLGSVNGTYVNLERIPPQVETQIHNGDTLTLANSRFTVKIEEES